MGQQQQGKGKQGLPGKGKGNRAGASPARTF